MQPPNGYATMRELIGAAYVVTCEPARGLRRRSPGLLVEHCARDVWEHVHRGVMEPPERGPWGLAWKLQDVPAWLRRRHRKWKGLDTVGAVARP